MNFILRGMAALQWVGCLWLTYGALTTDSPFVAFLAEVGIAWTVFIEWIVWRARRHA